MEMTGQGHYSHARVRNGPCCGRDTSLRDGIGARLLKNRRLEAEKYFLTAVCTWVFFIPRVPFDDRFRGDFNVRNDSAGNVKVIPVLEVARRMAKRRFHITFIRSEVAVNPSDRKDIFEFCFGFLKNRPSTILHEESALYIFWRVSRGSQEP